jgi:hypothetical protein
LPAVSTTIAKLVAEFAADVVDTVVTSVVDTRGAPWFHEFSKKIKTILMGYSGAGGKLIHEKNQKQKIL